MLEDKVGEAEEIFFRYAFPCTGDLLDIRAISEEDYRKMERYAKRGETPRRQELERIYKNAIRRMKIVAGELKKPLWDLNVVREYFLRRHNEFIDNGEGAYKDAPHSIRELCKVRIGKVVGKEVRKEENNRIIIYVVEYEGKKERIIGNYCPYAEIGDRISFHWKTAIEKIE